MALPKPLPALPLTDTVPPLTLDAKGHINDIVRYSLKTRSLSSEWALPLELALSQLAQWVAEGEWLAEIRASKKEKKSSEQPGGSSLKLSQTDAPTDASPTTGTGNQETSANDERTTLLRLHNSLKTQSKGTKHLLLTIASPPEAFATQEVDFQVVPAVLGCDFQPSLFYLPFFEDEDGTKRGDGGHILSGLDFDSDKHMSIIGGSFRLHGLTTSREYQKLVDVLTIGTYTILSVSLELTLVRDSGVELKYPVVLPQEELPPPPTPPASVSQKERVKARAARAKDGIWSYLTKQSENIFKRARTISQDFPTHALLSHPDDGDTAKQDPAPLPPFTSAVQGVKDSEGVLSTSPGIRFPPPILLTELAEQEAKTGRSDINASQNAGLRSLLGWSVDHNLSGPRAFIRHQCITALYSEYVSLGADQVNNENDHRGSTTSLKPCIPRKWRTYKYYSHTPSEDQPLGQMIEDKCSGAEQVCTGCKSPIHGHQLRWVTGRTRIMAELHVDENPTEELTMWLSCHECKANTPRQPVAHGTWLLSFGKYLELLAYSDGLSKLHNPLCEHTTILMSDPMDLIRCKSNIIRNFAYKSYVMSFSSSPVQDVYEVQIPRLQITKGSALNSQNEVSTIRNVWQELEKDKLRLEITLWWKGVKEHMGQLEDLLEGNSSDDPWRKPLPPSPPAKERQEYDEDDTPTPRVIPKPLPPVSDSVMQPPSQTSTAPSVISTTSSITIDGMTSAARLGNLRKAFNATEQALYASLAKTPGPLTNDVRRLFHSTAKAAANRLAAWEKKHASDGGKGSPHTPYPEPEWWAPGWHALPGGSVVIREGEWASIIAFTLSSSDYERELNDMSNPRATSSVNAESGSTMSTSSVITSTTATSSESMVSGATSVESSVPPSLTAFVTSMQAFANPKSRTETLDPDDDAHATNWYQPESSTSQVSRKEHPKEGSNILSLRDVLRNKSFDNATLNDTASTSGSKFSEIVAPSARAQPSLGLITKDVQGSIQPLSPDAIDVFEKIILDVEKDDTLADSISSSPNNTIKANVSSAGESTIIPSISGNNGPSLFAPPVPEKDFPTPSTSATPTPMTEKSFTEANQSYLGSTSSHTNSSDEPPMSTVGSLTSTIANAMRYVLSAGQGGSIDRPLPAPPFHNLLAMDSPKIDSKPHIHYDCIIGKRLKFSCTIYYAKQFDSLRRRCGIHETLIESLKRTENWAAEGGKSKSNFWKTTDDRFIIKTLVNAWNVADLQVLIELGPSYFHYMDKTAKKPSVMAKLLGFFTVELKNLENGAVQSKADLLVMENLFYQRTITQTFDLKGIEGRRVKPSSKGNPSGTMFDGEWLEGQKKALILLHPHSKIVLEEGISADADFLASSNIMDYSLLLGVDPDRRDVACGLVDTIGSYTFAKTLEYKAKQNIQKEVTVIPPKEYRDRFVRAVNSYFVACPDKWSHPGPDFKFPSRLPSVL